MSIKNIIICVDDEMTILNALKSELKGIFSQNFIVEIAQSGSEALEIVEDLNNTNDQIPLVISDYLMPMMKGDELLKQIHSKSPETIKIMLTGQATLEGVTNAMTHANLYRYISKPWQHEDFKLTVTEAINRYFRDQELRNKNIALEKLNQEQARLIKALKQKEKHLQQVNENLNQALQNEIKLKNHALKQEEANQQLTLLSHTDCLTEISNRRKFNQFLQNQWECALVSKKPIALGMIDVDWFKKYNDYYGHQAGDDCLRYVAQYLLKNIRNDNNLLARYGGEEFAFILPTTSADHAYHQAQAFCKGISDLAIEHEYSPFKKITVSIGVTAAIPDQGMSAKRFVERADQALYKAKEQGRNSVVLDA